MVSKPKLATIAPGIGGKVFSSSGSVISDSVTYLYDRFKPKPVPTSNDEIFAAGLKAQHEEMMARHAPRCSPTKLEDLPLDAQIRLKKFKAELDAKARGIGNFHGKLFGYGAF